MLRQGNPHREPHRRARGQSLSLPGLPDPCGIGWHSAPAHGAAGNGCALCIRCTQAAHEPGRSPGILARRHNDGVGLRPSLHRLLRPRQGIGTPALGTGPGQGRVPSAWSISDGFDVPALVGRSGVDVVRRSRVFSVSGESNRHSVAGLRLRGRPRRGLCGSRLRRRHRGSAVEPLGPTPESR